ncbi:MAG: triose-phosphate isomerase [Myxococcota bacterium]
MREPILAANWKMHRTVSEVSDFAEAFLPRVEGVQGREVVVAPPFPLLEALARALEGSGVSWAAQNVHPEAQGAFTGEVSAGMLADLGCGYAIVGHSERRALFGESSEFVSCKAEALLAHEIRPIVCVGETLDDREAGRTFDLVGVQLEESLSRIPDAAAAGIVVAYEPVWAIGTGRTATPEMAQEVHAFIRTRLVERFGANGDAIRIQYGGSVKPDNVGSLMAQPDIDGALVGGASLDPESFAKIVRFDD